MEIYTLENMMTNIWFILIRWIRARDPLGHLIHDAPEFLVGLACAIFGGKKIADAISQNSNSDKLALFAGLIGAVPLGYVGYYITKTIKKNLE